MCKRKVYGRRSLESEHPLVIAVKPSVLVKDVFIILKQELVLTKLFDIGASAEKNGSDNYVNHLETLCSRVQETGFFPIKYLTAMKLLFFLYRKKCTVERT